MKKNNSFFSEYLHIVAGFTDSPPVVFDINDEIKIIRFKEKKSRVFFSFGLSSMNHPEWINSKPELIVAVDSCDDNWGLVMGEIIAKSGKECLFEYGDLFHWPNPISKESFMNSYFLYTDSLIEERDFCIALSDRRIHFSEMYPIYEEEKEIINKIGAKRFFYLEDWDRFDVRREKLNTKDIISRETGATVAPENWTGSISIKRPLD